MTFCSVYCIEFSLIIEGEQFLCFLVFLKMKVIHCITLGAILFLFFLSQVADCTTVFI